MHMGMFCTHGGSPSMPSVRPGRQSLAHGGGQHFHVRHLGHVGWRGAMIGTWGLLSDRTPLPAASHALVPEVSFPVPGCSSGSGHRSA
jgi:hypothetical protein